MVASANRLRAGTAESVAQLRSFELGDMTVSNIIPFKCLLASALMALPRARFSSTMSGRTNVYVGLSIEHATSTMHATHLLAEN